MERVVESKVTETVERMKANVWKIGEKYYRFDATKESELFDKVAETVQVQTGTGSRYEYVMLNGEAVLRPVYYPIYENQETGQFINTLKNNISFSAGSGTFIKSTEVQTETEVERIVETQETVTVKRLKDGYIQKGNKYLRHYTEAEADALVNIKPYKKKKPPKWLKDRI